jgi:ornithine cyclodeaminase/alanine dehydrogenase-like protein (mu-crystallin family)
MYQTNLLYLSQSDVAAVGLSMSEIIEAVELALNEKAAGRVEMPPKPGIHPLPDAFIHAMPAYIPAIGSAGVKWVSGFPQNQVRGLPYISGLLILNDPETGIPLCVMDCTWITAARTGAATAVAAKHLARPESSRVGILGCGVQGRTNARALAELFSIKEIRAYDVDPQAADDYAKAMRAELGLAVKVVGRPEEAVRECDIVITAGPILRVPHATISTGWLEPGAFACPLDFDSYWHPDALAQADKFCTDGREQLSYYQQAGYFQSIPPLHADLAEIVCGERSGRESPEERIICCNLGLALADMATAIRVYRAAVEAGAGTMLPL